MRDAADSSVVSGSDRATDPLDALLCPRRVAVVGAIGQPGSVPYDIFANVLTSGFRGTLYAVAPGKQSVCAVRAYRYVTDIDEPIDLAVVVFPAAVAEKALEQCGEKGIHAAIIISAGFREAGAEGLQREQRIRALCQQYGIALIGPNCLGVINTDPAVMLNASFARKMPRHGRIGFLSQSGALCTAVLDYAQDKAIGFSKFVSFGNRAGVTEMDLLRYLHRDPQTDIILLYLEEIPDGRELIRVARQITRGADAKPIFAIKAGRTPAGAAAASSHTGSLATVDAVCDDLLADAGIVRVDSLDQLFNAAVLYEAAPLPRGNRVAIVTNGGGPGVMATDAAIRSGLDLPRFTPETTAKLVAALPRTANTSNPVDVIGDARADRYQAAISAVQADPNIDQTLVILTPQSMTEIESIARCVIEQSRGSDKLIACSFMGSADVAGGVRMLQEAGIPHYILPEWACRAMADLQRVRRWRDRVEQAESRVDADRSLATRVIQSVPAGYLPPDQAQSIASAYGLAVPRSAIARSREQAIGAAREIGFPVALKIVSSQIVHKSDVGGVKLSLGDADAVGRAYDQMLSDVRRAVPDAGIDGVLVAAMIPQGHQIILGARRDPSFGPIVMFGLGGVYVEMFHDIAFAAAPIGPTAALRLIERTRAGKLLAGFRGAAPADVNAVARAAAAVSQLAADFDRIEELDINPLICGPRAGGVCVADIRIRLN